VRENDGANYDRRSGVDRFRAMTTTLLRGDCRDILPTMPAAIFNELIREIYPHLVGKQHEARVLIGCPSSGVDADKSHRAADRQSLEGGMSAPRRTNTRADMSTGRFAIAYVCSDGIRGPVEGTKVFDSEGAAARAAAMLHFAKPHINYGVIDLDAKAAASRR
jgi:hypothetical protein